MEQLGRGARELVAEGYGQGRAVGRAEGRAAGRADGLTRLLQHRFNGGLTPEIQQQITAASLDELDKWFDRGMSAPTLEAVFSKKAAASRSGNGASP